MNLSKSVIFPLKNGNLSNISGIPIKTTVTYLGVIICKDEKMRNDLNCDPIIRKTNNIFNMWLFYPLQGGVLLSKAEGISRSVYVCLSPDLPSKVVKTLDKSLFHFILENKTKLFEKRDIMQFKGQWGPGGIKL